MTVYSSLKGKFHLLAFLSVLLFYAYNLKAQNPANYFTSATYIGGYHIKCNGQSTGTIKADPSFGTAPYTFLWSSGETTAQISNKPAGIYIVTMIDSLNDTHTDTFELRQPDPLSYQSTISDFNGYNVEATGGNRGSIQLSALGGTPAYRYLWSNGDNAVTRSGLTAGTYTFTITDANQCTTNGSITLTEPSPIQVNFSNIENPHCFNTADGKATISISGGQGDFSVVWDNGSFSLSPDDLPSGYNAVRIYEGRNAVLDTGITLTSPDEINVQFTYSDYNGFNVSCVDCFNGSITTTTTGGTAPYTYLWDDINNSAIANLSNLNGGEYNLMVIDANGCKARNSAQLTMPTPKDWSREGNANIDPAEFIGSTDASDVVFKSNNQEALRLAGNGNVGVKNANPTEALDIIGNLKTSGMMIFQNQAYMAPMDGANSTLSGIYLGLELTPHVPISRPPCMTADKKTLLLDGYFVSSAASSQGKPTTYFGNDGANGIIESTSETVTASGSTALLLNYYCGNNVVVGKPNFYGNLIANNKLGIGVSEPNERLEVAGNAIVNGRLSVGGAGNNGYFAPSTDYQLCVNGKIVATEVLVKNRVDWPDYVFKKDYKLKSINEVNNFIKMHGHLPEAPTAKEVEANGINTGEMLNLHMQKIEELTLYIIDLQKQIDHLKQAKK